MGVHVRPDQDMCRTQCQGKEIRSFHYTSPCTAELELQQFMATVDEKAGPTALSMSGRAGSFKMDIYIRVETFKLHKNTNGYTYLA